MPPTEHDALALRPKFRNDLGTESRELRFRAAMDGMVDVGLENVAASEPAERTTNEHVGREMVLPAQARKAD